ncbi:hypothetical protein B0T17DRAFT_541192 [Bombardia bombarda]|uniref:Uncharacterized protein n=1 Tax=Bombardia bombarda TaxID=252184 RepID=A0AA39WGT8_9PEZI|nr:hypothetical protein B0T17DRAFT_541192 [Bombardia bombarda]
MYSLCQYYPPVCFCSAFFACQRSGAITWAGNVYTWYSHSLLWLRPRPLFSAT